MTIQLSDNFTYRKLLKFCLPSVLMMIFTSIYGIVDGFFVSNFAGKDAFAAVNFIIPFLMILCSIGFMVGSGGSALIGKTLGEGEKEKANGIFSMLIYFTIIISVIIAVIAIVLMEDVAILLGAGENMAELSALYGRIIMVGLPFAMLQYEFQSFFILAEKPNLGLYTTLASGISNMVMDAVAVGIFKWGIAGAAVASVASQVVGSVIPLIYFASKNSSLLRLGKPVLKVKYLLKVLGNGSSEFVSNISMSVVGMVYNVKLLQYIGEDGVSAYGVLMYVGMIFSAIFIGYSVGTAPIISYHFGAQNRDELKNIFRKSTKIILISAFCMLVSSELLAKPFSYIFVGYDDTLMDITVHAFRFYSFSFLFCSVPIFGSSFFTALNNGLVSALISFLRTIVFQLGAVLILPIIWKADGIWFSLVFAEIVASIFTIIFLLKNKKKYGY